MKVYLIAFLAGLALLGVPSQAQEASGLQEPQLANPTSPSKDEGDEEVVIEVGEEEEIDIKTLLGDLVEYGQEEGEQEGKEEESGSERQERSQANNEVSDPKLIAKYNEYVDKFLNGLSASMSQSYDPMSLVLRRTGNLRLTEEIEESEGEAKEKKRRNKKKATRRHPKDVSLEDDDDDEQVEGTGFRAKREISADDNLVNIDDYEYDEDDYLDDIELEGRALDDEYNEEDKYEYEDEFDEEEEVEENTAVESAREGRELSASSGNEKNIDGRASPELQGRRRRPGRRRRRRRKGGRRRCGKFCQRKRRRNRRRRIRSRRKRPRGKRSIARPAAFVYGASKIRRHGDVIVKDVKSGQNVISGIEIGPLILKVEKTYDNGSNVETRQSEATAPNIRGKMVINFNSNGIPKLRKLRITRPKGIKVTGTLKRSEEESSDKAMKKMVKRSKPIIADKLLEHGIAVLETMTPVETSQ